MPAEGLALVARDGDAVVGTVRLWHVSAGRGRPALLLGPLAVDDDHRGAAASAGRWCGRRWSGRGRSTTPPSCSSGTEAYYRRFGFSAAAAAGLAMPGPFERHRLSRPGPPSGALAGAEGVIRPTGLRRTDVATVAAVAA